MTITNLNFGQNSRISSAEIIFAIDPLDFAGDTAAILTYSVFPVENKLNPTEVYYTSNTRNHSTTPISVTSTKFSVSSNGKTILRIKIDSAYAESLLQDTPNLTSNAVFQNKYKGYYIAASLQAGNSGAMYKADLEDDLSGFYLRYRPNNADTVVDFKFTFTGSTSAKYNTVKYYPKQNIKDQFLDSTLGGNQLYLKGMGLSRLKIQIPFLKDYTDSFQVAVNRAELIMHLDPSAFSVGNYAAPPRLTLLAIDSLGREDYIKDLLTTTDYSRYDGRYDATNKRYVFNLAREAQRILNGQKKNRGFYLVVANTNLSISRVYATETSKELLPVRRDNYIERVVLAGSNNASLKPVFNLNYIRFKND
jgi:hypothetical protein